MGRQLLKQAVDNKFVVAARRQSRLLHLISLLIVPAGLSTFQAVFQPHDVGLSIYASVLVAVLIFQILLFIVTDQFPDTIIGLRVKNLEMEETCAASVETIRTADAHIRRISVANKMGQIWSTVQAILHTFDLGDDAKLKEQIGVAIDPLIEAGGTFFGFDYQELFTAAVYRFEPEENILRAVWWKRGESHPSTGCPREWVPGDGHVGSAFMQNRLLFTTDAAAEETSPLIQPSAEKMREYDAHVYSSFVSAPISFETATGGPRKLGVLVLTSAVPGRFDETNVGIVSHAAVVLSHALEGSLLARRLAKA